VPQCRPHMKKTWEGIPMGSGPRRDSRSSIGTEKGFTVLHQACTPCPRFAWACHPVVWSCRPSMRGFTLIELVVSITVGAIISGSAGLLILNATRQHAEISARSELIDMGSAGMEVMLRYVREIRQDETPSGPAPTLNGNAQITTASATDLRFDTYGFRLNGGTIEITNDTAANWHPLITDVSGLTLTYYDRLNAVLTPLPLSTTLAKNVRRISIQIDLARGPEGARLRTSFFLRNFMNEVTIDPP